MLGICLLLIRRIYPANLPVLPSPSPEPHWLDLQLDTLAPHRPPARGKQYLCGQMLMTPVFPLIVLCRWWGYIFIMVIKVVSWGWLCLCFYDYVCVFFVLFGVFLSVCTCVFSLYLYLFLSLSLSLSLMYISTVLIMFIAKNEAIYSVTLITLSHYST